MLFPGTIFQRKAELRIHVAITSVYPLRAYYHTKQIINLASVRYEPPTTTNTTNNDKNNDSTLETTRCMVDSSSSEFCDDQGDNEFQAFLQRVPHTGRQIFFDDFAEEAGMTGKDQRTLLHRSYKMIADILKAGHSPLEDHPINQGIHASQAMCFSHLRFDLGVGAGLQPFLFEVTETPSQRGHGPPGMTKAIAKDLFHLIGLDEIPVPMDQRAEFELNRLRGWRPLPNLSYY